MRSFHAFDPRGLTSRETSVASSHFCNNGKWRGRWTTHYPACPAPEMCKVNSSS